jgi:heat shock protein HslJ
MAYYNLKIIAVLFVLLLFTSSCSESTAPEELSSTKISDFSNIQWNLTSVETPYGNIDLNDYKPFMFVLWNDKIWGYDNCNHLRGQYFIKNDSLVISNWGITVLACSGLNFPFTHLIEKPRMLLRGEEMVLLKNDTSYVYFSNYKKNVIDRRLLDKTLTLKNSNDSDISFFHSLGLYPKLKLTSNKEFIIEWYNKPPANTHINNSFSGVFGTNNSNEILFTIINFSYEGNGVSIVDENLVNRIINSNKFEHNNNYIRIINTATNTYYEFSR